MCSRIWRYLDFAKFTHLVITSNLHFTRIDRFKDKFEGSYPLQNLPDWESKYPEIGDFKYYRKFSCVSCWYESDAESAAMWEGYGHNGQGIAICTDKQKLKSSLEGNMVIFEKVRYIDFINEKAKILYPWDAFYYKRKEFASEREFRAMLQEFPETPGFENGFPKFGSPEKQEGYPVGGVDVPVDLNQLIDKVVFSPYAKQWYIDTVKNLLERFELESIVVTKSELSVDPVYPK